MHALVYDSQEKDLERLMVVPLMLWRIVHSLISWISVSRQRMPMGRKKVVDSLVEFEQFYRGAPGTTNKS